VTADHPATDDEMVEYRRLASLEMQRVIARLDWLMGRLTAIQAIVDEQAEDEGLWTLPFDGLQPIMEAYLQQELRRLHAAVEDPT
jgi:hypothetical protein